MPRDFDAALKGPLRRPSAALNDRCSLRAHGTAPELRITRVTRPVRTMGIVLGAKESRSGTGTREGLTAKMRHPIGA